MEIADDPRITVLSAYIEGLRDGTGLMFGLGFAQLSLVAAGVVIGSILMVTFSVVLGLAVLATGSGLLWPICCGDNCSHHPFCTLDR